jgi:hypothetical protein
MEKPEAGSREQMVEGVVEKADRWRLTLPAILMLEIARPFSFIASQGLLLCQPLLGFFYDKARIGEYAELLADRSNLDRLIASLEARNPQRQ